VNGFEHLLEAAGEHAIPFSAVIELTERCNFVCRHCYLPAQRMTDELPLARILRLLEELADAGALNLGLTGGEPLLYPGWPAVVERARELHFAVHVLTNGSLVDADVASTLAGAFVAVDVSIYGTKRETFESVTRTPGSFEKVFRGVEHLRAQGARVTLKVPVMSLNAAEADSVLEYPERLGVTCQLFPQIVPRRDGDVAPLALRLSNAPAQPAVSGASLRPLADGERPPSEDERPCAAGARFVAIAHNGDVLPCLLLPFPAGNILERSFVEIWRSSPVLAGFRSIRWAALRTCSSCPKLAYCGRCPAQALHEDGDLLGPSRWACERAGVAPAKSSTGA
jgi:radical SAM protein with 4Fe4S-binding SPASM domain